MFHRPRKRFSQNFLIDEGVIDCIIDSIKPERGQHVVEIGPGTGALTGPLIKRGARLDAIEIDRDLAAHLQGRFGKALTLHVADVLDMDLHALGQDMRIVGNLPYHISTPVLFHLAGFRDCIHDIHVMLQKEVVARMAAMPGDGNYGRLSVMLQYQFAVEKLLDVPAAAFHPAPKVDSAVARLRPHPQCPRRAENEALLARVVADAFSQRRKTLRNSLGKLMASADWAPLGLDPGARAQDLPVESYVAIANYLVVRGVANSSCSG